MLVVAALAGLIGCHELRLQGGLVNVPAPNRDWTGADFAHDVIANGDESCPALSSGEQDRLAYRWPACNSGSFWGTPPAQASFARAPEEFHPGPAIRAPMGR